MCHSALIARITRIVYLTLVGAMAVTSAQAAPLTYIFSASDFSSFNESFNDSPIPASIPASVVSGSVTLDGSIVIGIDLTIAGHTYLPADVGFYVMGSTSQIVGGYEGYADSISSMTWGTNDFRLWGDFIGQGQKKWVEFSYTVDGIDDMFDSTRLSVSVVPGVSAVPEPETYAMFLAGLGGLGAIFGRRKRAAQG